MFAICESWRVNNIGIKQVIVYSTLFFTPKPDPFPAENQKVGIETKLQVHFISVLS